MPFLAAFTLEARPTLPSATVFSCRYKSSYITPGHIIIVMAIGVVEFSREGYKIRKVFALESTYPKEIFEF